MPASTAQNAARLLADFVLRDVALHPVIIREEEAASVSRRWVALLVRYEREFLGERPEQALIFRATRRMVERCRAFRRCKRRPCPCCAATKAIAARRRLEAHLAHLPASTPLAFVTLTVACDGLQRGWAVLKTALGAIRRRAVWSEAALGGAYCVQVVPTDSDHRTWLPHAHVLVEVVSDGALDSADLDAAWQVLVGPSGLPGSTDVRPVRAPWDSHRGERFSPLAFYITRDVRSEWLEYAPDLLGALLDFLPGRRLAATFGWWRGCLECGPRRNATMRPGSTMRPGARLHSAVQGCVR